MPGPYDRRQDVVMSETTLYLFDGYNLLHASEHSDPNELVDMLASFVAEHGARGVVVFDGSGVERQVGPLSVRWVAHADDLLERLAAEHRGTEQVCIVSSDDAVRRVSGQEVRKLTSRLFLAEFSPARHRESEIEQRGAGGRLRDRLDEETRERLERLRRGE
jgi:predicted RNA-binding protein with PIN domain